ncbi:MAG: hypothetical protein JST30_14860 [Armatimonadetes bacterium]|nr:hypothetical protein [Armatimonadota bacterium]
MVLNVAFEHVAEEAKRHGVKPWAYVSPVSNGSIVTIADPSHRLLIQSFTNLTGERLTSALVGQGLLVAHGRWLPDPLAGEIQIQEMLWTASVAYKSASDKPGLWVHGYRGAPSVGDVVRDFYEEMSRESGLVGVSLEDFVSAVDPNVVITGPDELAAMAAASNGCP